MTGDEAQTVGEQLAGWGKVALVETRGRLSGRPARTAVGFWQAPDAGLYVAAGSETADWALNLRSHPRCRVTIADQPAEYAAEEVEGDERATALRELILKYGTPAERLGRGPVFRLTALEAGLAGARMEEEEQQSARSRGCGVLGCLLLIGLLAAVVGGGVYLSDALDPLYDRYLRAPHEVVADYFAAYERGDEERARRFLCAHIRDDELLDPTAPLDGRPRGLGGDIDEFPYPRAGGQVAIYYTLDQHGPSAQALLEREDEGWRICELQPG